MKLTDYIKKGERWYIRLPGGMTLIHVAITDVTEQTVEMKDVTNRFATESRYKKADIEFVEKTGPFPPPDGTE